MTADVREKLAAALYDLIVDHPMWIDGQGRGLDYSPEREARIGDFLEAAVEIAGKRAAEAWDEGHSVGWEHCQDGNYGNDHWDDDTPNPYRAVLDADPNPAPEPVTHNHTRFRNDAGPWSPCPASCPVAGLLR